MSCRITLERPPKPPSFARRLPIGSLVLLFAFVAGLLVGVLQQTHRSWAFPPPADTLSQAKTAFEQENYQKALSSAQDGTAANLRLGQIYMDGDLVPPDFALARLYLKRAAYSGNAKAAQLLGDIYRRGLGTAPDPKKAYAWSDVAVVEGDTVAQSERDQLLYSLNVVDERAALTLVDQIFEAIKLPPGQGMNGSGSVQRMSSNAVF